MAQEFRLPDIGEGLTEAEIVRWLVPVGGRVEADQALVEVETDKAVVEIPSPYAGTVLQHGAREGATVHVGEILAVIGESGGTDVPASATAKAESAGPVVAPETTKQEPPAAPRSKVLALPVVRKLARELGVDLSKVRGSGKDGKITRDDVLLAAKGGVGGDTPAGTGVRQTDERVPLTRLRRTIAEHMERSWREIPHVTTFDEVDASRLLAVRNALGRRNERVIPLEALIVEAVMPLLRQFPEFNATLDGADVILHHRFDIGVAVDTPEGLIVPVVRGADRLSLLDLATEILRLSEAAKTRTLVPDEVTGATFSVSNIGALGGGFGTPIIPYGTTAILSFGRAVDKPVVVDGSVRVAPMAALSLSYDHRIIDGGLGRRFMAMLLENLAEPALFLTC